MRRSRKPFRAVTSDEGSNPSPSALPDRHRYAQRARMALDVLGPRRQFAYGQAHRCQRAELWLPRDAGPHPVVVALHGGSWRTGYSKVVMRPIAGDLARQGFAVWNVEYRRVGRGQGGGWPATFADVAAAIDALATVPASLDTTRVTLLGHSAGAALALWAGARAVLPDGAPGARPRIAPVAVVAQAAPADLAGIHRATGGGAVDLLMGGSPERYPERYAIADPIAVVPPPTPVLLVHGSADHVVSVAHSRRYAAVTRAAGGEVELVELDARSCPHHRSHVDPASPAWAVVRNWLLAQPTAPGLRVCPTC
jgi:acetyl esterase/lipase